MPFHRNPTKKLKYCTYKLRLSYMIFLCSLFYVCHVYMYVYWCVPCVHAIPCILVCAMCTCYTMYTGVCHVYMLYHVYWCVPCVHVYWCVPCVHAIPCILVCAMCTCYTMYIYLCGKHAYALSIQNTGHANNAFFDSCRLWSCWLAASATPAAATTWPQTIASPI